MVATTQLRKRSEWKASRPETGHGPNNPCGFESRLFRQVTHVSQGKARLIGKPPRSKRDKGLTTHRGSNPRPSSTRIRNGGDADRLSTRLQPVLVGFDSRRHLHRGVAQPAEQPPLKRKTESSNLSSPSNSQPCDACGSAMQDLGHCKAICRRCGFMIACSG